MPRLGIYNKAWHLLGKKVSSTRKRNITKEELRRWFYDALEQAIDEWGLEEYGKQETPEHQGRYPWYLQGGLHEQVQHGEQAKT